jgi:hypothetical protein
MKQGGSDARVQSGGDRAVASSMQKTSVMLLQTTDSQ